MRDEIQPKAPVVDLTKDTFFDHLLDPDRRRMLVEAPRAEEGTHLPLNRRYGDLAFAATDADRLGRAVFALLEETPGDGAPEDRLEYLPGDVSTSPFLDPSRNWTADASTQAPGAPDRVDRPDTGNR